MKPKGSNLHVLSKLNNIWLSGSFFCLHMQRVNQKHPQKAFHLSSCCDNWRWWYSLTMSTPCAPCIHSLMHILKVEFHFSSVLQPRDLFPPCFARCCDKDGVLSTPWFHGLWDLLTLSVEWTPNEIFKTSFHCLYTTTTWLPARNAWLKNSIICPNLFGWWWERALSCRQERDKGTIRCQYWHTCFPLDLWLTL